MQNPLSEHEAETAFELLRRAVADLEQKGRSTVAAGVKPEMQRLADGKFDEKQLGFASFGAFVGAAENAGAVVRVDSADGHPQIKSVRRTMGSEPSAEVPADPNQRADPRLRADLWRCFVDWRENLARVYDRQRDKALMFPAQQRTDESPAQTRLRTEADDQSRFVPIEPISMETQYNWIREFIDAHSEHPLAVALRSTLDQDRPVKAFTHVIQADPELADAWKSSRLARVAAVVSDWIGRNGLSLQPWKRAGQPPSAQGDFVLAEPREDRLRALVHRAVDRMPAAELMRLAIPLEYLTRDSS